MDKLTTEEFTKDLETLLRKYDVIINGCGCCDSPELEDAKEPSGIITSITDCVERFSAHYNSLPKNPRFTKPPTYNFD